MEISATAGHANSAVTQRYYRNSPRDVADYKASVRFFQECLQSLLINGQQVARFGFDPEAHEWFKRLAIASGIESACGLSGVEADGAVRSDFVFAPTLENMLDLYLAHRALMSSKLTAPASNWNVQGVPLLGLVLAIRQWVFEKGFGEMYRQGVRRALKLLAAGEIALPTVLEI